VLRDWALPECFLRLRQALERRHGGRAGARQYIRVLQLLAEHPLGRVQHAVEKGLGQEPVQAERIIALATRLADAGPAPASADQMTTQRHSVVTSLCQYQVPRPDLGRFDQLLSQGGPDDGQ
jgi:hypothetical protein